MSKGRHPDDQGDWLVVIVTQAGFRKSPFKSYTKTFHSVDDLPSATAQLLEWWYSLPADSYTRSIASVQLHWCNAEDNDNETLRRSLRTPESVEDLLRR